jgi:hypothetical protein
MSAEEDQKVMRARNIRTGLIVAGIAFAIFLSIIIRTWYLRGV